jgi:hypothetical protein
MISQQESRLRYRLVVLTAVLWHTPKNIALRSKGRTEVTIW